MPYYPPATGGSSLPVADTQTLVMGSADNTKLLRFEVDGFTAGATRVMTPPNADATIAGLSVAQTFTATNTFTGNLLAYKNGETTNFLAGNAGNATITGTYNVGIGELVMEDATSATQNMGVGAFVLQHVTDGTLNMGLGYQTLLALTTGDKNTGAGAQALNSITITDLNTGVGFLAGASNTGSRGTFIGARAGHGSTGSDNVLIGYLAGFSTTASNVLYIANSETETPLIYGEFDNAIARVNGRFQVHGLADQIQTAIKAHSTQTNSLFEIQDNSAGIYSRFNKAGYFMTRKLAAPADADLATSELAIWFDDTAGAAKLMIKAKNASGTVVTGNMALA